MTPSVHERYVGVLRKHLRLIGDGEEIPFDRDLVEVGLDSIGTIGLLLDLEQTFAISFPHNLLTAETFRTASSLETAVASLVDGS